MNDEVKFIKKQTKSQNPVLPENFTHTQTHTHSFLPLVKATPPAVSCAERKEIQDQEGKKDGFRVRCQLVLSLTFVITVQTWR